MKSWEYFNNPRFPPVRFVLIKKAEVSMHLSVLKQVPGTFPDFCDQLFGLRDAFFFPVYIPIIHLLAYSAFSTGYFAPFQAKIPPE
jgi:hypothetical protein